MALKSITEADLKGKKVLARFDFNVPLKNGQISDSSRIDLALPTIRFLLEQGISKLTLMSHLGRPKGKVNPDLSLEPVADYLANQLNEEVILTESAISNGVKELLTLKSTKIVLLENLRFHPEEEQNGNEFAKSLSDYGEIYVNDAFGAAHRKHASVYNINKYFPNRAYAGLLLKAEIDSLNKILHSPKKPFMAIIGGAKISDKIKTIEKLLVNVDKLFIGGAMAYPFLKAKGQSIGNSLCNEEDIKLAKNILKADKGKKLVLPIDHMIVEKFGAKPITSKNTDIEEGYMGIDIGPKTIAHYQDLLKSAKTILWNGPMGVFENPDYAKGTMSLCETIAGLDAFSLVGGGDSVSAVNKSGLAQKFSHVSTGGGASLEYIEKGELPGIQALKFGV
ncbi:MAG: phosphoglycerate kinase [Bacteriovoracaceae bacterium]|jgi:phosphoglycerate kinase|nr:phosphoglycerate kinase [Halobacteriovoraceae bacterium]MDP7320235.1 phosphoglycerate kinase [Bacteriovoracaceae bacterium]